MTTLHSLIKDLHRTPRDPDQDRALDMLIHGTRSMILSGGGGTGKTYILSKFIEAAKKEHKNVIVAAPTGVAASLHQEHNGTTIHSLFGFTPRTTRNLNGYHPSVKKKNVISNMDVLIVDEISMVRADLVDTMDAALRYIRGDDRPFGGVRMIFCGDLAQLPPVVQGSEVPYFNGQAGAYENPYFISAFAFKKLNFALDFAVLTHPHRQTDDSFAEIVDGLRYADPQSVQNSLQVLNSRVDTSFIPPEDEDWVILTGTRAQAERINNHRTDILASAGNKVQAYEAKVQGKNEAAEKKARKLTLAQDVLQLTVGSQVMFINNDKKGRWINGTVGKVVETLSFGVSVDIPSVEGETRNVFVEPFKWEVFEPVAKKTPGSKQTLIKHVEIGSYSQIPLIPAWGVTIHKAQGQSFERAIIDLSHGAFADGQTYVAVSRCTSLNGLVLTAPLSSQDVTAPGLLRDFDNLVKDRNPKVLSCKFNKDNSQFAAVLMQGPFFLGEINTEVGREGVAKDSLADVVNMFAPGAVPVGDVVPGLEDVFFTDAKDVDEYFVDLSDCSVVELARATALANTALSFSEDAPKTLTNPETASLVEIVPCDPGVSWNIYQEASARADVWAHAVYSLYSHLTTADTLKSYIQSAGVSDKDMPSPLKG